MITTFLRTLAALMVAALSVNQAVAQSEDGSLEITVAGGEFQPISVASPAFFSDGGEAANLAAQIRQVVMNDLVDSGLFRSIEETAFIEQVVDFDVEPTYADWQAINADALFTGHAKIEPDGRVLVKFRLFDPFSKGQVEGLQFFSDPADWRRIGHKIADAVYAKMTGEGGYFDSRIVYVDERGPKGNRQKRLAIMDQDGENLRYLTSGGDLVLTPRFSPKDQEILYISYERGQPQI
ncbi:MAG: Tol-Pal system protein TolB, partial [Paracoccaceae bacterium]|nr:Tol-Pal system protein TolB [Paracoccaceae bacterium]